MPTLLRASNGESRLRTGSNADIAQAGRSDDRGVAKRDHRKDSPADDFSFYNRRDAARVARVPYATVSRWLAMGVVTPSRKLVDRVDAEGHEGFSLADVGYLHLLRHLTNKGVPLEVAVRLLYHLTLRFGPPSDAWREAQLTVQADVSRRGPRPHGVMAYAPDGWDVTLAIPGPEGAGQAVIAGLLALLPLDVTLENILVPPSYVGAVEINVRRAGGLPVCRGTNVRTAEVYRLLKKMSVADLRREYYPHVAADTAQLAADFESELDETA